MGAAEIIQALGGSIATGMCRCPAHNDTHPSLKVSEREGKVLVHCKAGCIQDAVIEELKARGLWQTKKASTIRTPSADEQRNSEEQEQDPWDKFKNEAYPILRTTMMAAHRRGAPQAYLRGRGIDLVPPSAMLLPREQASALRDSIPGFKGFPAMVLPICGPNGLQGASVTFLSRDATKNLRSPSSNKNIRRIYGSAKGGYVQLGDIDPDQPPERVVVAEGIETALSAAQLIEAPAIAVLGANNYESISPPPCGELIVAADNNKVGREAAAAAAALWAAAGRKVRVAVPPEHKDWNDALRDRNADPDQLKQLLLDGEQVKAMLDIRALSMEEVLTLEIAPPEFLVDPWLTTGSLAMIQAKRGVGKTRFAMAICHAIAYGNNQFLSWNVGRKARVLYVDGELPTALLQKRLRELGSPIDNLHIVSRDILLSRGLTLPDLGQPEGRDFLDRIIEREQSNVIVLDSLSTLIRSGVENEAESWSPIQDWLLAHRFRNRSIVFLHHEGRSGQARGTTKREDALDTIIRLQLMEQDANDEETILKLTFEKRREFYGTQASSLILHLTTRDGTAEWGYELEREHTRERAATLQREGMKQKDIAKELGISPSWLSRLLGQA